MEIYHIICNAKTCLARSYKFANIYLTNIQISLTAEFYTQQWAPAWRTQLLTSSLRSSHHPAYSNPRILVISKAMIPEYFSALKTFPNLKRMQKPRSWNLVLIQDSLCLGEREDCNGSSSQSHFCHVHLLRSSSNVPTNHPSTFSPTRCEGGRVG